MSATLPSAALPLPSDKIRTRHRERTRSSTSGSRRPSRSSSTRSPRGCSTPWSSGPASSAGAPSRSWSSTTTSAARRVGLDRPGFQRLLAEVALDQVGPGPRHRDVPAGALLQGLASAAGVVRPVRDADRRPRRRVRPGNYNDRLLLGLKGTMSEAELHLLKTADAPGPPGQGRRAASWSAACRSATSGAPRARSRSIRTSRSARRSGWSSTCSSAGARPAPSCAYLARPRHPPARPRALRATKGELRWHPAQPGHARRYAPPTRSMPAPCDLSRPMSITPGHGWRKA